MDFANGDISSSPNMIFDVRGFFPFLFEKERVFSLSIHLNTRESVLYYFILVIYEKIRGLPRCFWLRHTMPFPASHLTPWIPHTAPGTGPSLVSAQLEQKTMLPLTDHLI